MVRFMTPTPNTPAPDAEDPDRRGSGILCDRELHDLVAQGEIGAVTRFDDDQIQPASLDLRLGSVAYRLRASFLPGTECTVAQRLQDLVMHTVDLERGAVLETGCVYLVPLMETLRLSSKMSGIANPKSSTGRLDVFTRLITDHTTAFDRVEAGYKGPLYAEISPRTFSILVRAGSRLNQLRLRRGSPRFGDANLRRLHETERLTDLEPHIDQGLVLRVNLDGLGPDGVLGYRAKRHAGLIDVDRKDAYDPLDFWDPIAPRERGRLILDPDEFYILASKETIHIPPDHAAEMVPFDPLVGEFRVHYAGFFDPGFGNRAAGGTNSRAVLEVRSHEVPFVLEDGQIVGRLVYEPMTGQPDRLYGRDIGSHYQRQGLKLSKHFKTVQS